MSKRTFVYIDSFNLYYGIRKFPNSKWLNVDAWLKTMLPISSYDIQKIKFFTANIGATPHDLQKPIRQAIYFRALSTIPTFEIIKGRFKKKAVNIQISKDLKIVAKIPEEKGTDVNLGVHLINDGHLNKFDTAVVVTNDSDLAEAISITARDLKKEVWVINPCIGGSTSPGLVKHATTVRTAREGQVRACQFNPTLTDKVGTISKPATW